MAFQSRPSLLARKFSNDNETPAAFSIVKVRLPISLPGPGSIMDSSGVTGANRRNYHTVIVRSAIPDVTRRCTIIRVWPVPSYSFSDSWLASQPDDFRNRHIPLPCQQDTVNPRPTPTAFGAPLQCGGYQNRRPGWVFVKEVDFDLPFTQTVCFPTCSTRRTSCPSTGTLSPADPRRDSGNVSTPSSSFHSQRWCALKRTSTTSVTQPLPRLG